MTHETIQMAILIIAATCGAVTLFMVVRRFAEIAWKKMFEEVGE
jgi:uncharacterized membrane protein YdjX (TVP38/TMEM64 family)